MQAVGQGPPLMQSATAGLRHAMAEVSARAADVSIATATDSVDFSDAAREAAGGASAPCPEPSGDGPRLENALVDLRVAKYAAMANMRVVSTAADLQKEAMNMLR